MHVCVQSPKVFRISHRAITPSNDMPLVPRILRSFAAIAIVRGTLAFDSLDRLLEDAIPILFPPVRMSLHLCRLEREDAIELSKKMSSKRFIHEIHRELDGFTARMHDIWEHRDLYVLDLNCDYAIPLLRAVRIYIYIYMYSRILKRDGDSIRRRTRQVCSPRR